MHPHHYYSVADDASDYGDNGSSTQTQTSSCGALLVLLFFLCCTFFTILLIYALCTNNTEPVRNACPDLYPYMMARTALGLCVFMGICGLSSQSQQRSRGRMYFFIIYFMVLSIWGGVVLVRSMVDNASCTNALFDSFFQAPILGTLGWVYFILDVLYTLGMLLSVALLRQETLP